MLLYLFRAKVRDNDDSNKIFWAYGSLNRIECKGYPIDDYRKPWEKDLYQIITTDPKSSADWGLPYLQKCYNIANVKTIGMYTGGEDSKGRPIFEDDYVTWQGRTYLIVYNEEELSFVMEKVSNPSGPVCHIRFNKDWASSVTVCGNKWDGIFRGGEQYDIP